MSDASTFGGPTAMDGSGLPMDSSGGKGGGGTGGMDFSQMFDPSQMLDMTGGGGPWSDAAYNAQASVQPAGSTPDTSTGGYPSPGAGQQSGQQPTGITQALQSFAQMFNPFGNAAQAATPRQACRPRPWERLRSPTSRSPCATATSILHVRFQTQRSRSRA